MAFSDYFSVVATFIALRETLEAGIIIAVLLGFVEQLLPTHSHPQSLGLGGSREHLLGNDNGAYSTFGSGSGAGRADAELSPLPSPRASTSLGPELSPTLSARSLDSDRLSVSDAGSNDDEITEEHREARRANREKLVRTLKRQVWTGALLGLAVASLVGGVFLFVFYTFAHDLWQDAENLWEGIFCGVASIIILVMGLAFLRLPHARTKWRLKLLSAIHGLPGASRARESFSRSRRRVRARAARGWLLFGLPFITVLREGLEGVVFLGGIGVTDKPFAILMGALTGFAIGGLLAYTLFARTESMSLQHFTTFSTVILFLMGAGLASRSAYGLERQYFINGVGQAAAESGDGPGSYRVAGNIWKLTWGNPEVGHEGYSGWWQLAQSLVGWNNIGTVWAVGTYQAYWIFITVVLIARKYKEGRTELCGHRSARGQEIYKRRRRALRLEGEEEGLLAPLDVNAAGASGSGSRRSEDN